jgi:DNA-binding FadR family transcriptional regulator
MEVLEFILVHDSEKILINFFLRISSQKPMISNWPKLHFLAQFLEKNEKEEFLNERVDYNSLMWSSEIEDLKFLEMLSRIKNEDFFFQIYFGNNEEFGINLIELLCSRNSIDVLQHMLENDKKDAIKNFLLKKSTRKLKIKNIFALYCLLKLFHPEERSQFIFECVDVDIVYIFNELDSVWRFFQLLSDNSCNDEFIQNYFGIGNSNEELGQEVLEAVCRQDSSVIQSLLEIDRNKIIKNFLLKKSTRKLKIKDVFILDCLLEHFHSEERSRFIFEHVDLQYYYSLLKTSKNEIILKFFELLSRTDNFHEFLKKYFEDSSGENDIFDDICCKYSMEVLEFILVHDSENLFKNSLLDTTLPKVRVENVEILQYLVKNLNSDEREQLILQRFDYEDFLGNESDQSIKDYFKMLSNYKIFSKFLQKVLKNETSSEETENGFCQINCKKKKMRALEYIFEKDSSNLFKNCLINTTSLKIKPPLPPVQYLNSNEFNQFIFKHVDLQYYYSLLKTSKNEIILKFFELLSRTDNFHEFLKKYFEDSSGENDIFDDICCKYSMEVLEFILVHDSEKILINFFLRISSQKPRISNWPKLHFLAQFLEKNEKENFLNERVDYNSLMWSSKIRDSKFIEMLSRIKNEDCFFQIYFGNNEEFGINLIEFFCSRNSIHVLQHMLKNDKKDAIKNFLLKKSTRKLKIKKMFALNCLLNHFPSEERSQFIFECVDIVYIFNEYTYNSVWRFFKRLSDDNCNDEFIQNYFATENSNEELGKEVLEAVCRRNSSVIQSLLEIDRNKIKNFISKKFDPKLKIKNANALNCLCELFSTTAEKEKFKLDYVDLDTNLISDVDLVEHSDSEYSDASASSESDASASSEYLEYSSEYSEYSSSDSSENF